VPVDVSLVPELDLPVADAPVIARNSVACILDFAFISIIILIIVTVVTDFSASARCEKQQAWSKETSDVFRKSVAVLKQILH
jgi:hypothetical protein